MAVAKPTAKRKSSNRSSSIIFRTSPAESTLIRKAAAAEKLDTSVYARKSILKQAEMDIAARTEFVISEKSMKAFLDALEQPVQNKPRLKKLLTEDSVLD